MTQKTRDSFIFYRSFYQAARKLPAKDKAELFDAICCYALDGESLDLSVVPEAIFTVIQPNLDANRRKWANGCKDKKSKTEAKDKQKISKPEGNVNVNVDVNVDKDKDVECKSKLKTKAKKPKGFTPPTLQEVKDYCQSRNNSVNAKKFFDYYDAGNWKDAKGNQVKNWKQKLLTWEGKQEDKNLSQSNRNECTVDFINNIAKHTLLTKIIVSASNKAQIWFKDKVAYDKYQNLPDNLKTEIKNKIASDLNTNGFEPKF